MDQETAKLFLAYHHDNPQVFTALCKLARQALALGKTRGSIQLFWEQLRWEEYLRIDTDAPDWKLNNNWRAYYADYLVWRGILPAGFFETRGRNTDG
jgi:hypothetical protein